MPRKHGTSQEVVSYNIRELRKSGKKQSQAVAIAEEWKREDARKKRKK